MDAKADSTGRRRDPLKIVPVVDQPQYFAKLGKILYRQWPQWYQPLALEDPAAVTIYLQRTVTGTMPCKWVALSNKKVIGTIGLEERELGAPNYGAPWLVDLWVHPEYRSLGLGRRLIQGIFDHARRLGIQRLFLWTEDCADYYRKLGWTYVEHVGTMAVFFKTV